jgi:hypothetical protein
MDNSVDVPLLHLSVIFQVQKKLWVLHLSGITIFVWYAIVSKVSIGMEALILAPGKDVQNLSVSHLQTSTSMLVIRR